MKRLCVYCGSSMGANSIYEETAAALGKEMARRKIELVYGGGGTGLMGVIANTVIEAGGHAVGIMPRALYEKEVGHDQLSELYVVASMHERKTMMATLSDGFVALPGGYGTLEEFVEIITWSQLGFHNKPCILLNVNGFYDKLLGFFDHLVEEGYVQKGMRQLVLSANSVSELFDIIDNYKPVATNKWIERQDL